MQDIAGNHLDGVFYGSFPSGNGIPRLRFRGELYGYHNKIFAPRQSSGQRARPTAASAARRSARCTAATFRRSCQLAGPGIWHDPTHLRGTRSATAKKTVTRTKLAKSALAIKSDAAKTAVHDDALKALVDQVKHGRLHK